MTGDAEMAALERAHVVEEEAAGAQLGAEYRQRFAGNVSALVEYARGLPDLKWWAIPPSQGSHLECAYFPPEDGLQPAFCFSGPAVGPGARELLLRGIAHALLEHQVVVIYGDRDDVPAHPEAVAARAGADAFIQAFTRPAEAGEPQRRRMRGMRPTDRGARAERNAEIERLRETGMSGPKIAKALDVSVATVYQVLHRAKRNAAGGA